MMNAGSRLFVALSPSAPVAAALATLHEEIPGLRWTPPEEIHLTLRFIGGQRPETCDAIADALTHIRVKSFFLDVEGVGGFPERGEHRVLWAGVGNGHPLLHQLRQQVDDTLLAAGVVFDLKPFVPHLTIGRCEHAPSDKIKQWLKRHRAFAGPIWPVSSFALWTSDVVEERIRRRRIVKEYALG